MNRRTTHGNNSMRPPAPITPGMTFPYHLLDSNPLWRVVKHRGGDTWDCIVTDESLDYAGTHKVFGGEEIRRAKASEAMWNNLHNEHDSWWHARKIGETVHYSNGFGQFVRGRIIHEISEEFPDGRNVMVCEALVGKWRAHELPHYDAAGQLQEGTYARYIREGGHTMQPNFSNMVEAVGVRDGEEDPLGMPAINLTSPTPTAEQAEAARLMAIRKEVLTALNLGDYDRDRPFSEVLQAALEQARTLLNYEMTHRATPPT